MFRGDPYRINLAVVSRLHALASELGMSLPQLAIAWTLANPAVHVAIVGTRNAAHIHESITAVELHLDAAALTRIDDIASDAVAVPGPSPEAV
jgi:hypothetical protein